MVARMSQSVCSNDARARAVIENVEPQIDGGRFPIKRVIGDTVTVEADIFADGHDAVSAAVLYRRCAEEEWSRAPLQPLINDRWRGKFKVEHVGTYQYAVTGWIDQFATWKRDLAKRIAANQDIAIDLLVGADLVRNSAARAHGSDR